MLGPGSAFSPHQLEDWRQEEEGNDAPYDVQNGANRCIETYGITLRGRARGPPSKDTVRETPWYIGGNPNTEPTNRALETRPGIRAL